MGVTLQALKNDRPGISDDDAIRAFAEEYGYHVVVMYDDRSGEPSIKGLFHDRELEEVRSSPYVSKLRVVYDDGQLASFEEANKKSEAWARKRLMEESVSNHAKPSSSSLSVSQKRLIFGASLFALMLLIAVVLGVLARWIFPNGPPWLAALVIFVGIFLFGMLVARLFSSEALPRWMILLPALLVVALSYVAFLR